MRLICDRTTRVSLGGVDISGYIVGLRARGFDLDPWQSSVLRLYLTPFQTPEMWRTRERGLSRMRTAYRSKARHR